MEGSRVHAALGRIATTDSGRKRKKITILGAGLSGLVAAYELSQLGHQVQIVEASSRIGGRAWTHRFADGEYHEFGAMRVPESHDFTRHYAIDVCGLQLRTFINHHDHKERFYFIRGIRTSHEEAPTRLLPAFKLSSRERDLCSGPAGALGLLSALGTVTEEIKHNSADLAALFMRGPMTPRIRELEAQSLGNFLFDNLDTEEALELVGAVTSLEVWWHKAVTMFIRDDINGSNKLQEIVGGADRLPTRLSELIIGQVEILLKTPVRAIHNRSGSIQLVLEQADGLTRVDADIVICTIPFPVLRRIELSGLSAAKNAAIRNLSYASATKVLLSCNERFWERAGVVGGGSQSDQINRQIYYPSDNYVPEPVESVSQLRTVAAQYRIRTAHGSESTVSQATSPGVLVGSYCWGADARRVAALPPEQRVAAVVRCVGEVHPEILEPGMLKDGAAMAWGTYEWAGAAFSFLEPGDLERYYFAAKKPQGRLFFAGEHCSLDQGWMQGAIESGLEAVEAIVGLSDSEEAGDE